ncbi:MAG TPA: outer membrane lipoprotein carrier protein LolA [Sphingomonas sp.]|uniref:LolA family protein n=1 Tax=Sphingomonas sp. TaxID=28214 RepID=UPI002C719DD4|nr:outer membrane lipoprotein carrier protein LolA [Sphingomonas sp.]HMI18649.1 outer membrane lipoprotein carrier protein LolA [Sphingomonas sp.]
MHRFFIAAALIAAPAAAQAGGLVEVQAHLRAVTTMTAGFAQTDRNGRTLTGTITLKQPGKIRFQYQQGVPLLIVGDGKALTMIDYQVAQVSRWPVGNSPLGLLLDPSKDISRYAHLVPGSPDGRIVIEGRDPKHPEFGTITIGFAPKAGAPGGLMLAGWSVLDAQGNRTTTVLSDQKFGMTVSDRTFLWRDPRPQTGKH